MGDVVERPELPCGDAKSAATESGSPMESMAAELEEAWGHVHELTKALTNLTGGGSEFFIRRRGRYIADTKACVDWVRRVRQADHQRTVNAIHDLRAAERRISALSEALTKIVDERVFNQQRFAEDTDTDYFLRCFRAVKEAARRALTPDQSVGRESDDAAPERTNTPGSAPNG